MVPAILSFKVMMAQSHSSGPHTACIYIPGPGLFIISFGQIPGIFRSKLSYSDEHLQGHRGLLGAVQFRNCLIDISTPGEGGTIYIYIYIYKHHGISWMLDKVVHI